jgi:hypothetical protein
MLSTENWMLQMKVSRLESMRQERTDRFAMKATKILDEIFEKILDWGSWREVDDPARMMIAKFNSLNGELRLQEKWMEIAKKDRSYIVNEYTKVQAKLDVCKAHRKILLEAVNELKGWSVDGVVSWSLIDKDSLGRVSDKCHEALIAVGEIPDVEGIPF